MARLITQTTPLIPFSFPPETNLGHEYIGHFNLWLTWFIVCNTEIIHYTRTFSLNVNKFADKGKVLDLMNGCFIGNVTFLISSVKS